MMSVKEEKEAPQLLLSPGMLFDKYRIIRFVGHGGMAEVYQAEHLLLKQTFALKVIKNFGAGQSRANKRFLREAKCFHLLDHPNIVRVYDIGWDNTVGCLYIAMEFLEGGNLLAEKGKKFQEKELLAIARDISLALMELEKKNMVHRDIKPSNIMCTADGRYKLMDLGIAKTAWEESDGFTLTQDDVVIGTPAYASPEQCRTPHRVDIRADIYSLGVTLYQLASGETPYAGKTSVETILNVLNQEPPSLEHLAGELTPQFRELLRSMMAKDPEARPRDAKTLNTMTEAVLQGRGVTYWLQQRKRPWDRILFFSAAMFLMFAAGFGFYSLCEGPEEESVPQGTEKTEEKVSGPAEKTKTTGALPEKSFLFSDFAISDRPRDLEVRLEESRKVLAFLRSPAAAGTSFLNERIKFFTDRENLLRNLLRRKNKREERACRISCSPELRHEIEECLKNCRTPFRFDHSKYMTARKIMEALRRKELDPDTIFTDGRNEKRSLTGIALTGFLPWSESMLKQLIFAGADIDSNLGNPVEFPSGPAPHRLKRRLAGIRVFNGADNIDAGDNGPLLLSVINPRHIYLVCGPDQNGVDWDLANFLVDSGALPDCEDLKGKTPLHYAAMHDRGTLVTKILLAGSNSGKCRDHEGNTPYHCAVRNNAVSALRALERFGMAVPVSPRDRAQGALVAGIMKNNPEQIGKALEEGASLDYVYFNGFNALQNAVAAKNQPLVQLLMEKGAALRGNEGSISAPAIAICVKSPEIFSCLLDKCPSENGSCVFLSEKSHLPGSIIAHYRKSPRMAAKFFDILLKHKWDINRLSLPSGKSVLQQALTYSDVHVDVIRYLLEKGADPSGKALQFSNPAIRQLLIEAAQKKASRKTGR